MGNGEGLAVRGESSDAWSRTDGLMQRIDSPSASGAELAATIADLAKLDGATLKAQSQTLYGSAPPRRITRGLLIRAVAYRLQEQGFS